MQEKIGFGIGDTDFHLKSRQSLLSETRRRRAAASVTSFFDFHEQREILWYNEYLLNQSLCGLFLRQRRKNVLKTAGLRAFRERMVINMGIRHQKAQWLVAVVLSLFLLFLISAWCPYQTSRQPVSTGIGMASLRQSMEPQSTAFDNFSPASFQAAPSPERLAPVGSYGAAAARWPLLLSGFGALVVAGMPCSARMTPIEAHVRLDE
ncbi:MAG: hypothetical protein P4M02_08865 [Clostridia bacterium]|nr:hypothetical protein [Clostridia bacterium]